MSWPLASQPANQPGLREPEPPPVDLRNARDWLRDRAIIAVLLGCALHRCEVRRSLMGHVERNSRRRRKSPHGMRIRRTSAICQSAVAATDNSLLAPEPAGGITMRKAPAVLLGHTRAGPRPGRA